MRYLIKVKYKLGQVSIVGSQGSFYIVGTIACDVGKADFHFRSFGQRPDDGLGLLWLGNHGLSAFEGVEWHTYDAGIFRRELPCNVFRIVASNVFRIDFISCFIIRNQVVTLTAQSAAHHLLAKQLTAKGTDTTNMGHGVGIPTFSQHRHADHTLDVTTQFTRLAHGVYHFPQNVGISETVGGPSTMLVGIFMLEILNLFGIHFLEVAVNGGCSVIECR